MKFHQYDKSKTMSENTSPAIDSVSADQPAATNHDNASESNTTKTSEAQSTESKPAQSQPVRKEPKQGVRDTRTNKSPESAESAEPLSEDYSYDGEDGLEDKSGENSQQNNQQGNSNNNRSRGRRGRKTNDSNPNQNSNQNANQNANQNPNQQQQQQSQIKLDAKAIAKKAWKIFLAEVGEEGLALIGDKEAKELTKRSFRLGEIFQEEEQRRIRISKSDQPSDDVAETVVNHSPVPVTKKSAKKKKKPNRPEQRDAAGKVANSENEQVTEVVDKASSPEALELKAE